VIEGGEAMAGPFDAPVGWWARISDRQRLSVFPSDRTSGTSRVQLSPGAMRRVVSQLLTSVPDDGLHRMWPTPSAASSTVTLRLAITWQAGVGPRKTTGDARSYAD